MNAAMLRRIVPAVLALAIVGSLHGAVAQSGDGRPLLILAAGQTVPATPLAELTPEERMQRRFPQPVRVGDLDYEPAGGEIIDG